MHTFVELMNTENRRDLHRLMVFLMLTFKLYVNTLNDCDEFYCVVTIHQLPTTRVCIFTVFNLQSMLDIVC